MNDAKFTEELIPVKDLDVDRSVQRDHFDMAKVDRIVAKFNPAALNVITVSRRNAVTNIVIDGMHRTRAVQILTDNTGNILSHVFEGLTRKEEAQMFLDLNAGTQPTLIDKFHVRIVGEDPIAVGVSDLVKAYGFSIGNANANGTINAVGAVERIYTRSLKMEAEPNLLQLVLISVTSAWGTSHDGIVAAIIEGLGAFFAVNAGRSEFNLDRFKRKLELYKGGPLGLLSDARSIAAARRGRVSMAVAELLTDDYNKGAKTNILPAWKARA